MASFETYAVTIGESSIWPKEADPAPAMCDAEGRLVTLASYSIDRLSGDKELVNLARFAARLCETPQAAVSLVERERQVFLASEGLDIDETPRSTSLCAQAMLTGGVLVVPDASDDPRFADFALVTGDAHLRFYAGAPLISAEGAPLGSLCVIDSEPRPEGLSDLQREGLLVLADAVKRRLLSHRLAERSTAALQAGTAKLQSMIDSVPDIAWSAEPGPTFDYVNKRWTKVTGKPAPRTVEDWREVFHPDDYEDSKVKFVAALQQAKPFEDEWRMRQADGTYRWVLSRAIPSSDDPETARWFGTLTDIDDARRVLEEREMLAGELAHRIKNIFSIILGLISLRVRGDATSRVFSEALSENIRALARAQDFTLKMDAGASGGLKELLEVLMAPYQARDPAPVTITGDDLTFGPRVATPLALVFFEMATNAAKYGALGADDGTLKIDVARTGDSVQITWEERGGPPSKAPEKTGFGTRLAEMSVSRQLGGKIEREWLSTGLRAVLTIPLKNLQE